ncbi:DNA-binding CsgD family transcriptional regulator [Agrobacterium larrymoorei]|uniref:DNA-binding CsgD family transcriptional regulator n=1 Tax=Agrobacterium larrymoorei TaxID=160699 RepID=A0AAJ2BK96_9HYPH|nr:LuxR C-terminal-related transcriptional regulator [Agrobacterium larrymoorei]MDR6104224.1 DNA-binding CsgD family transcriptional regulator [Agrobacterium larrymoorei]
MRPNVSFIDLARRLTDAWLASSGEPESSAVICCSVKDLLKINMVLISIEMAATPANWRVEFVRKYGIPTGLMDGDRLQNSGPLGNSPDMGLLKSALVEVCQKVMITGRPLTGRMDQTIENARMVASGIVLPDPTGEKAWCVVLGEVHSITMVPRDTRFDDVDLSVLQLLREGMSARGIGSLLELSPRTVEHRIEKIKARVGVTSITALTALRP